MDEAENSPTFFCPQGLVIVVCICFPYVFLDLVHRNVTNLAQISMEIEGIPCRPDRTIPVSVHPEVKVDGIIPSYFQFIGSSK